MIIHELQQRRARRSEIQGYARGTFVISWLRGTVLILGSQIVALMTSPGVLGAHAVVRLGPTPVVFAALVLNVLVLGLIIRRIAVQTTRQNSMHVADPSECLQMGYWGQS